MAKTKYRVGSESSEESLVQVSALQGSLLLPLVFAIVDVSTNYARAGLMNEILYADDLVVITQSTENLREAFEMERGI